MAEKNLIGRLVDSLSLSGLFSGSSRKPTIILLVTPLILTTWKYYGTKAFYLSELASRVVLFGNPEQTAELYTFFSAFVLFGLLPWAIVKFVFKESISSYGLQLGDWRFGLKAFLILAPIFILAFSGRVSPIQRSRCIIFNVSWPRGGLSILLHRLGDLLPGIHAVRTQGRIWRLEFDSCSDSALVHHTHRQASR
jgi:hypothetical protein